MTREFCDKCKCEVGGETKVKYKHIEIEWGYDDKVRYLLCFSCAEQVKVVIDALL